MSSDKHKIRHLNDRLRCQHRGGRIMLIAGIRNKGADFITLLDEALTTIVFDRENDPHDEHDFGSTKIMGDVVFFKIDYYDLDFRYASPDPADETVTRRVMTIMLAEEY